MCWRSLSYNTSNVYFSSFKMLHWRLWTITHKMQTVSSEVHLRPLYHNTQTDFKMWVRKCFGSVKKPLSSLQLYFLWESGRFHSNCLVTWTSRVKALKNIMTVYRDGTRVYETLPSQIRLFCLINKKYSWTKEVNMCLYRHEQRKCECKRWRTALMSHSHVSVLRFCGQRVSNEEDNKEKRSRTNRRGRGRWVVQTRPCLKWGLVPQDQKETNLGPANKPQWDKASVFIQRPCHMGNNDSMPVFTACAV